METDCLYKQGNILSKTHTSPTYKSIPASANTKVTGPGGLGWRGCGLMVLHCTLMSLNIRAPKNH